MPDIQQAYQGVQSLSPETMPPRLNWSVLWVKGDTVVEKWCDDDFVEALRIYDLARKAGKKSVTLRCANYFFPPPESLRWHVEEKHKVVRRGDKRYRKTVHVEVEPMIEENLEGRFWCGYCCQLRELERRDGFVDEGGRYVPNEAWYCPMCGCSHVELRKGYKSDDGKMKPCNPGIHRLERRRRARRATKSGGKRRRR